MASLPEGAISEEARKLAASLREQAPGVSPPDLLACLEAFCGRDYPQAASLAQSLVDRHPIHGLIQVLGVSLMRTGEAIGARVVVPLLAEQMTDPWEQRLVRLTVGLEDPQQTLTAAVDQRARCQTHCYSGIRLASEGRVEAARREFDASVAEGVDCFESRLSQHERLAISVEPAVRIRSLAERLRELVGQGRHRESLPIATEHCELTARQYGPSHPEHVSALLTLGEILTALEQYDDARRSLEQGVGLARAAAGPDPAPLARGLTLLAAACVRAEAYDQAERAYEELAGIVRSHRGEDDAEFAKLLLLWADLCAARGDLARAEALCQRAGDVLRAAHGEEHGDFAAVLLRQADLHMKSRRPAAAIPLYERASDILARLAGPESEPVYQTLLRLAQAWKETGDVVQAGRAFWRCMELRTPDDDRYEALKAFARHDYARAGQLAFSLIQTSGDLLFYYLLLIALERMGADAEKEQIASFALERTASSHPWEHALFRLILGRLDRDAVLQLAETDVQRCQVRYYAAMRLLGEGRVEEGRSELRACLACRGECQELILASLELEPLAGGVAEASETDQQFAFRRSAASRSFEEGRLSEAYAQAEEAFSAELRLRGDAHPDTGLSRLWTAMLAFLSGDHERAAQLFAECLKHWPATCPNERACLEHFAAGHYRRLLSTTQQMIGDNELSSPYYLLRLVAAQRLGCLESLASEARSVAETEPSLTGAVAVLLGDQPSQDVRQLGDSHQDRLCFCRAAAAISQGKPEEAQAAFGDGIAARLRSGGEITPDVVLAAADYFRPQSAEPPGTGLDARLLEAVALFAAGQREAALDLASSVCPPGSTADGAGPADWTVAGALNRLSGRNEAATACFRAALARWPFEEPDDRDLVDLFAAHEYERCATEAQTRRLCSLGTPPEVLQAVLISAQRLGGVQAVEHLINAGDTALAGRSWERRLFELTAGLASESETLAAAESERGRCQAEFYAAARRFTCGEVDAARAGFVSCLEAQLRSAQRPCLEAVLAGLHFDAPLPESGSAQCRLHLLESEMQSLTKRKEYALALDCAIRARDLAAEAFGNEPRTQAVAINNLAVALQQAGRLDESLELHRQALAMRRQWSGEDPGGVAQSLHNLCMLHCQRNEFAAAELCGEEAAALCRKMPAASLSALVPCLHLLAKCKERLEKWEQVEPLLQEAVDRTAPAHGGELSTHQEALNRLQDYLLRRGEDDRATEVGVRLFTSATGAREASDHVRSTIQSVNAMARHWAAQPGEQSDGMVERFQAIVEQEKEVIRLENAGRTQDALALAQKTLEELQRLTGTDTAHYAAHLSHLAMLHHKAGEWPQAVRAQSQSVEILRRALGDEHPSLGHQWEALIGYRIAQAKGLEEDGDWEAALETAIEARDTAARYVGKTSRAYAGASLELFELAQRMAKARPESKALSVAAAVGLEMLELGTGTMADSHPGVALEDRAEEQSERSIAVFVSSTFRDMMAEREMLVKQVFPRLRTLCEARGVGWVEVDLRWGINEEQVQRAGVVRTCLAAIDRCRPFFLCMLGERYGWQPERIEKGLDREFPWIEEYAGCSVTELEIIHAVLRDPQHADQAFFYFRDPKYLDRLPPSSRREDFVAENERARQKLVDLKRRIRRSPAKLREGYADAEEFGKLVLEDFTALVERLFPAESAPDPRQREALQHEAFAQTRRGAYVARLEDFEVLDHHARAVETRPLVVTAVAGMGKSSLLANWACRFRQCEPRVCTITHFAGCSDLAGRWPAMLRRIMAELQHRRQLDGELPEDEPGLIDTFSQWLARAAAKGPVALVIDGLDELSGSGEETPLCWLPSKLPPDVSLIASTAPGPTLDSVLARGWNRHEVAPLRAAERTRLVESYLQAAGKSLLPDQVRYLVSHPQTANPLFLRTLLEELRLFGSHEAIDHQIAELASAATLQALFDHVLKRLEADYERDRPGLVRDALSLLWASRLGLSEVELLELLGPPGMPLPQAVWTPLFLAIRSWLVTHAGRLRLDYADLRAAVAERYLRNDLERRLAHEQLAAYFHRAQDSSVQATEWLWQLACLAEWEKLAAALARAEILHRAWTCDPGGVAQLWRQVEASRAGSLREAFMASAPLSEPGPLASLAGVLAATGNWPEAAEIGRRLIELLRAGKDRPHLASALARHITVLRSAGRSDEAAAAAAELAELLPPGRPAPAESGSESSARTHPETGDDALRDARDRVITRLVPQQQEEEPALGRDVEEFLVRLAQTTSDGELLNVERQFFRAQALANSRPQRALPLFELAQRFYAERGIAARVALCLIGRADILSRSEQLESALELLREAERIARATSDCTNLRIVLFLSSGLLKKLGREIESAAGYQETVALCRQSGQTDLLPHALLSLAQLSCVPRSEAELALDETEALLRAAGQSAQLLLCRAVRRQLKRNL